MARGKKQTGSHVRNNTGNIVYCGEVRFGAFETKELSKQLYSMYKDKFDMATSEGTLEFIDVSDLEEVVELENKESTVIKADGRVEKLSGENIPEERTGDFLDRYAKTKKWQEAVKEVRNISNLKMCEDLLSKAVTMDIDQEGVVLRELRGKLEELKIISGKMIGRD